MPRLYRGVKHTENLDSIKIPELPTPTLATEQNLSENEEIDLTLSEDLDNRELSPEELQQSFSEGEFSEDEFSENHKTIEVFKPEPVPLTEQELKELYKDEFEALHKNIEQEYRELAEQQAKTAIEQAVNAAVEKATNEASERAYQNTVNTRKLELEKKLEEIDGVLSQLQQTHGDFLEKYADELKYLAVDIAEKFVLNKLDENDQLLKKLVFEAVADVKNSSWLEIELSNSVSSMIDEIKQELDEKGFGSRTTVTTKFKDKGKISVSGEEGTIVADISTQAQNLKDLFLAYDIDGNEIK